MRTSSRRLVKMALKELVANRKFNIAYLLNVTLSNRDIERDYNSCV